ncbi:uncharacterized protein GIQ15_01607 [Arthroderma uncinatum]|uniref:uncharacterized protein n=1 Tax=Arthroderma uncinatum TaxID=74035 RepID=UPI00144A5532|nr:uncharacterized protein GIQ15_01607 [Arthroderma uncinatum]KAF3492090.1 hypothetical protein GIQ15_01607 [Arthroderma uncinatum]
MPQYKKGQNVRYKPVGGAYREALLSAKSNTDIEYIGPDSNTSESVGCIKSVLTEPGNQAGRNVNASEDNPRYEVENQNTGKTTTIYEENILGSV